MPGAGSYAHGCRHAPSGHVPVLGRPVRWLSYLRHDPRLRLIKVSAFKAHASNLPVRGWLFVVR
jgi:hypothetical protein